MDENESMEPGAATHMEPDERGEHVVIHPAEGTLTETAQELLRAAVEAGYPESAVGFTDGAFTVPQEVADAANVPEDSGSYVAPVPDAQHVEPTGGGLGGDDSGDEDDDSDGDGDDQSDDTPRPTERSNRADIDAYAAARGIDTTGAANKTEALALIPE